MSPSTSGWSSRMISTGKPIRRQTKGGTAMKRMILWAGFIILCLAAWSFETASAAGKPDVTRHEAKFLENAVKMHIEWQSPNPVTLVKISMPNVDKELIIDPYDNKRNRDGYSGEVDVTLNVSGVSGQSFTYVIQLQDELRIKSKPVTGHVKISSPQQPVTLPPPLLPPPVGSGK
jgi:hypothetical protein